MIEEEEQVIEVGGDEIAEVLENAIVMPPVTVVGAHVTTGVNPNLVTEEVVTTVELLALTPSPTGDQVAIFTLIMEPALAESLGLEDIDPTPEEETTDGPE